MPSTALDISVIATGIQEMAERNKKLKDYSRERFTEVFNHANLPDNTKLIYFKRHNKKEILALDLVDFKNNWTKFDATTGIQQPWKYIQYPSKPHKKYAFFG